MHLQVDVLQIHAKGVFRGQAEAAHMQGKRAALLLVAFELRGEAANHHLAQARVGFLARIAGTGHAPGAQNGAVVTQASDFVELVADVENAASLGGELAQHHKELFHGLRREHGGWLI